MWTRSSRLSSVLLLLAGFLCLTSLRAQEVDTVYLLNHWSKSRQAGSRRDFEIEFDKALRIRTSADLRLWGGVVYVRLGVAYRTPST